MDYQKYFFYKEKKCYENKRVLDNYILIKNITKIISLNRMKIVIFIIFNRANIVPKKIRNIDTSILFIKYWILDGELF